MIPASHEVIALKKSAQKMVSDPVIPGVGNPHGGQESVEPPQID